MILLFVLMLSSSWVVFPFSCLYPRYFQTTITSSVKLCFGRPIRTNSFNLLLLWSCTLPLMLPYMTDALHWWWGVISWSAVIFSSLLHCFQLMSSQLMVGIVTAPKVHKLLFEIHDALEYMYFVVRDNNWPIRYWFLLWYVVLYMGPLCWDF